MEELREYYYRFFGQEAERPKPFLTRLNDWQSEFPSVTGAKSFAMRILKALLEEEKICIFADYDTDAVSATSVLYWSLVDLGIPKENLSYYAPDRFTESYGLNLKAITKLSLINDLIITVDCGINSNSEADYLNTVACDLIITDHHQIKDELPNALTVCNPQIELTKNKKWLNSQDINYRKTVNSLCEYIDCDLYWNKMQNVSHFTEPWPKSLVGAGVVWVLMVYTAYYLQYLNEEKMFEHIESTICDKIKNFTPGKMEKLLSFVAIGTIADIQSVKEPLNRKLIKAGLKYLNSPIPFPGLKALLEVSGLSEKIQGGYILNTQDIGFTLSPILNASGRISHASLAMDCMTAWDENSAMNAAKLLIVTNQKRKDMVKEAMISVTSELVAQEHDPVIVIAGPWNKGIVGLIASRITGDTGKCAFVISTLDLEQAGSARAPIGYNLVALLNECTDYLLRFGGHNGAAGFTLLPDSFLKFKNKVNQALVSTQRDTSELITGLNEIQLKTIPSDLHEHLNRDNILLTEARNLNPEWYANLWKLEPYGQNFPLPLILIKIDNYNHSFMGEAQNHAKISLPYSTLTAFSITNTFKQQLESGSEIWLLVKPSINFFRGVTKYEAIVEKVL